MPPPGIRGNQRAPAPGTGPHPACGGPAAPAGGPAVRILLTQKGAFHVKVHYSSSQLTCWFSDDAYRYRVYVREEVLASGFIEQFRDVLIDHLQPVIDT